MLLGGNEWSSRCIRAQDVHSCRHANGRLRDLVEKSRPALDKGREADVRREGLSTEPFSLSDLLSGMCSSMRHAYTTDTPDSKRECCSSYYHYIPNISLARQHNPLRSRTQTDQLTLIPFIGVRCKRTSTNAGTSRGGWRSRCDVLNEAKTE